MKEIKKEEAKGFLWKASANLFSKKRSPQKHVNEVKVPTTASLADPPINSFCVTSDIQFLPTSEIKTRERTGRENILYVPTCPQ